MVSEVTPGHDERPQARWGLGDAVGGFLVGLLATTLVAGAWLSATGDDRLDLAGRAVSQLAFWVGLAGAAVLATRLKGSKSLGTDFGFSIRWSDVGLGLAAGVLAHQVVLRLVALLLEPVLGDPDVGGPVRELVDETRGPAVIGLFVFVVVGAAVVEELFFRGLLLRALQRRLGTPAAIGISSVVFGATHIQDGLTTAGLVIVIVSLSVLGAVFALLAVRTARLGSAIVAHASFNLLTLLLVQLR